MTLNAKPKLELYMRAGDHLHINAVLAETPGLAVGVRHATLENVYVYANYDDTFELLERVDPSGRSKWLGAIRYIQGAKPDPFNLMHREVPADLQWRNDKENVLAWGLKMRLAPENFDDEKES